MKTKLLTGLATAGALSLVLGTPVIAGDASLTATATSAEQAIEACAGTHDAALASTTARSKDARALAAAVERARKEVGQLRDNAELQLKSDARVDRLLLKIDRLEPDVTAERESVAEDLAAEAADACTVLDDVTVDVQDLPAAERVAALEPKREAPEVETEAAPVVAQPKPEQEPTAQPSPSEQPSLSPSPSPSEPASASPSPSESPSTSPSPTSSQ